MILLLGNAKRLPLAPAASRKAPMLAAMPIPARAIQKATKAILKGIRLSNLDTNHPDTGNPTKELMGSTISRLPSWASWRPKVILIVGILEAQVEKQNPDKKKKVLSAIRCWTRKLIGYIDGYLLNLEGAKMEINFFLRAIFF